MRLSSARFLRFRVVGKGPGQPESGQQSVVSESGQCRDAVARGGNNLGIRFGAVLPKLTPATGLGSKLAAGARVSLQSVPTILGAARSVL